MRTAEANLSGAASLEAPGRRRTVVVGLGVVGATSRRAYGADRSGADAPCDVLVVR
jgi:hypothetical protein